MAEYYKSPFVIPERMGPRDYKTLRSKRNPAVNYEISTRQPRRTTIVQKKQPKLAGFQFQGLERGLEGEAKRANRNLLEELKRLRPSKPVDQGRDDLDRDHERPRSKKTRTFTIQETPRANKRERKRKDCDNKRQYRRYL
jgi:hypothetical protein